MGRVNQYLWLAFFSMFIVACQKPPLDYFFIENKTTASIQVRSIFSSAPGKHAVDIEIGVSQSDGWSCSAPYLQKRTLDKTLSEIKVNKEGCELNLAREEIESKASNDGA